MPTLERVCKRLFSNQSAVLKCLIGGLLMMVPVAHFLAFGVLYALIEQAGRGQKPELPSWRGWRRLFAGGRDLPVPEKAELPGRFPAR